MENKKEFMFDNRILLALAEMTGDADRQLNNIFIFQKQGEPRIYYATDGYCALKVVEKEPEFNFEGEFVLALPDVLKKIIKYNKKEANEEMNKTFVTFGEDGEVELGIYNDMPMKISFTMPESRFEEFPQDIFKGDWIEQRTFAFNPTIVQQVNKALKKLGFDSAITFGLGDRKLTGSRTNEEFEAEFAIMGCRKEGEEDAK